MSLRWGDGPVEPGEETARSMLIDLVAGQADWDTSRELTFLDAHALEITRALLDRWTFLSHEVGSRGDLSSQAEADGYKLLAPEIDQLVRDEEWFRGPAQEWTLGLGGREFRFKDGHVWQFERHKMVDVLWKLTAEEEPEPLDQASYGALDKINKIANVSEAASAAHKNGQPVEEGEGSAQEPPEPAQPEEVEPEQSESSDTEPGSFPLNRTDPGSVFELEQEVAIVRDRTWHQTAREIASKIDGPTSTWAHLAASELAQAPEGAWCCYCAQGFEVVHLAASAELGQMVWAHPKCVADGLARQVKAPAERGPMGEEEFDLLDRDVAKIEAQRADPHTYTAKHNPDRLNRHDHPVGNPTCYLCFEQIERGALIQRSPGKSKRHHVACVDEVMRRIG